VGKLLIEGGSTTRTRAGAIVLKAKAEKERRPKTFFISAQRCAPTADVTPWCDRGATGGDMIGEERVNSRLEVYQHFRKGKGQDGGGAVSKRKKV
jgi:hypothetical protein